MEEDEGGSERVPSATAHVSESACRVESAVD